MEHNKLKNEQPEKLYRVFELGISNLEDEMNEMAECGYDPLYFHPSGNFVIFQLRQHQQLFDINDLVGPDCGDPNCPIHGNQKTGKGPGGETIQ